jgi:hypothetical protein
MTELAQIQKAVEQLSEDELRQFRAWFEELQARLWDEQIERDFASGKLDGRAERWRADHKAGKFTDI